MHVPRYATIEKVVGETPLMATERLRHTLALPAHIPMAYAGRLDPMASGRLLVLIGDTCKQQSAYHQLDKTYLFSILFGIGSDTGDVLGLVREHPHTETPSRDTLRTITTSLVGDVSLPYPHFSSRTVQGKPLHVWTLEGRLGEIEIPVKHSRIYSLELQHIEHLSREEIVARARAKIETIPPVTDASKELGRDFRRNDVRAHWEHILKHKGPDTFMIAHLSCTASSGTYMRSLAELIAKRAGTAGLAYAIHRTTIGHYVPLGKHLGFWRKRY